MYNFDMVQFMHSKFKLSEPERGPRTLTHEECRFRITAMFEELFEYVEACNSNFTPEMGEAQLSLERYLDACNFNGDNLEDQFDALLDLAVFTMGTADRQNFPWDQGFERVMAANCKKQLGPNGEKRGGFKRDLVKPEGWKAPDLSDLVTKNLPRLVVLEGADGTGKSTIANYLAENYNAHVVHRTWSPDLEKVMDDYLLDGINEAVKVLNEENRMVVLDRSFLSEWIYSETFRGGTQWKGLHRAMCNGLNGLDAFFVICAVSDSACYQNHFTELKESREEMYSDHTKMNKVNMLYNRIIMRFGELGMIGPNLNLLHWTSFDLSKNPDTNAWVEQNLIPKLKGE